MRRFKENVMKAVRYRVIFGVVLVLITVSGALVAQSGSREFVPFRSFIANTTTADSAQYLASSTSHVKDAASLEQMRQHILTMYQGVEVNHSFLLHSQYFDCVPVEQQPSVRLLGLKNIASVPPQSVAPDKRPGDDRMSGKSAAAASQLGPDDQFDPFGNSVQCEAHTIPMRRITLEEMSHFKTLQQFFEKGPNGAGRAPSPDTDKPQAQPSVAHKYAYTYQYVNNIGGNSSLNLWSPYVNNIWFIGEVFSLSQQWYVGGNQTAEGGWQNYPSKYGSENAALFIYWTADGYQNTGCYNLDCAAFVQVNHNWFFGSGFANYSINGGAQYELPMQWYLYAGNWWLQLGGQWVGYYPGSIYGGGQMSRNAQLIEYGGETVGSWIWPPMGSGQFANAWWTHAAYQRNIWYRDTASGTHWAGLTAAQPSPSCYTDDGPAWGGSGWGIYFFLGGPGGTGC
jgi:hypothetical protein